VALRPRLSPGGLCRGNAVRLTGRYRDVQEVEPCEGNYVRNRTNRQSAPAPRDPLRLLGNKSATGASIPSTTCPCGTPGSALIAHGNLRDGRGRVATDGPEHWPHVSMQIIALPAQSSPALLEHTGAISVGSSGCSQPLGPEPWLSGGGDTGLRFAGKSSRDGTAWRQQRTTWLMRLVTGASLGVRSDRRCLRHPHGQARADAVGSIPTEPTEIALCVREGLEKIARGER